MAISDEAAMNRMMWHDAMAFHEILSDANTRAFLSCARLLKMPFEEVSPLPRLSFTPPIFFYARVLRYDIRFL